MGCKFSFKRVFFVASLCLAGLFGISSVVVNEQVKTTPIVEEVKADAPDGYKYVFFMVSSSWNDGPTIGGLQNSPSASSPTPGDRKAYVYVTWNSSESGTDGSDTLNNYTR